MENLGAMAYSPYTGFREITDRDVLELHCIKISCQPFQKKPMKQQMVCVCGGACREGGGV